MYLCAALFSLFFLYRKNLITGCLFLLFNSMYFPVKRGRKARKCLEMLFMTSDGKSELPRINWHSKYSNTKILTS